MNSAVILGAGFSYVAGLPLTRELYSSSELPTATSVSSLQSYKSVKASFDNWANKNPNASAEVWLSELYEERENLLQPMIHGTTWDEAVRFALASLVNLPKGKKAPYYYGISTYNCHPIHDKFWKKIESIFPTKVLVSMNYDIFPEQSLHSNTGPHRTAPRCYYGGFQYIQVIKKMTNVIKREYELLELGHDFVLYKLHGSLNWAWEPHSPTMKIHDDVRAVFRCGVDYGTPAIIPPIPEKEMPKEFAQIWNEAELSLGKSDIWIVCGYSLPSYDIALKSFFGRILSSRNQTTIFIIDPASDEIARRWKGLSPNNIRTVALPGLPDALNVEWT